MPLLRFYIICDYFVSQDLFHPFFLKTNIKLNTRQFLTRVFTCTCEIAMEEWIELASPSIGVWRLIFWYDKIMVALLSWTMYPFSSNQSGAAHKICPQVGGRDLSRGFFRCGRPNLLLRVLNIFRKLRHVPHRRGLNKNSANKGDL